MTMHLVSPATSSRHRLAYRSMPVRLGALALAVVFTAAETQAQGPIPSGTSESQSTASAQTQPAATAVPASNAAESSSWPEAPQMTQEQASVTKPIDIKAIMDDAAPSAQNLQPTTTQVKQHQTHPGWLVLSAVGALGATIGAIGLSKASTRGRGVAAGFVGVGAGLTGLGLYLTFK